MDRQTKQNQTQASLRTRNFKAKMDNQLNDNWNDDDFFRRPESKPLVVDVDAMELAILGSDIVTIFKNQPSQVDIFEEEEVDETETIVSESDTTLSKGREVEVTETIVPGSMTAFSSVITSRHKGAYIMTNETSVKEEDLKIKTFLKTEDKGEQMSNRQKKIIKRKNLNKFNFCYDLSGKRVENVVEETALVGGSSFSRVLQEEKAVEQVDISNNPTPATNMDNTTNEVTIMKVNPCRNTVAPCEVEVEKKVGKPTIPWNESDVEFIKERFISLGYEFHGAAVLNRKTGMCWSVSFSKKGVVPNMDDFDCVQDSLTDLGLEDHLVYGLREFYTSVPVVGPLHRWQVLLEPFADCLADQQAEIEVHEYPIETASAWFRPQNAETEVEESVKSEDQKTEEKKRTLVTRRKQLFRENPEAIVDSVTHGKITVTKWLELWKERKRAAKTNRKQTTVEVVREETATEVSEFSDDSIPTKVKGTIKQKVMHAISKKQQPEKVVGSRVWKAGKSTIGETSFSNTLTSGLKASESLVVFKPAPAPKEVRRVRQFPKCPIPGLPMAIWRRQPVIGKTDEELLAIATQCFERVIRSQVNYLKMKWFQAGCKGRNNWLTSVSGVIAACKTNPIEKWWASYTIWDESARAELPVKVTAAQRTWSQKSVQSDNESQ